MSKQTQIFKYQISKIQYLFLNLIFKNSTLFRISIFDILIFYGYKKDYCGSIADKLLSFD